MTNRRNRRAAAKAVKAKKAPTPKGPITGEELQKIFGGAIPSEAAMLLLNPTNKTVTQLRHELHHMAKNPKPITVEDVMSAIWMQTVGGAMDTKSKMAMLSAYNFGVQQKALDPTGAVKS